MAGPSLEGLLAAGARQAEKELRKQFFYTSVDVLCKGTTPRADRYLEMLSAGLGKAYALEEHFDEFITPSYASAERNAVIAHEASKEVIEAIKEFGTVRLNGQKESLSMDGGGMARRLLSGFVERYNDLNYKDIVKNEQRLYNFTLEYFYGVQRGIGASLPEYRFRERVAVKVDGGGGPEKQKERQEQSQATRSFSDVIGMDEQKDVLRRNAINVFRKRQLYESLVQGNDVNMYPNFVLHGPGGTGKSYFASAAAGELARALRGIAEVGIITRNGSDFVQEYHGRGKNMLEEVYEEAAKHEVAVVWIDEADPICYAKGTKGLELNLDVTSKYLTILDGPETKSNVITILTTNNLHKFDRVLLSRFPDENRLYFGPIPEEMQKRIFAYHIDKFRHDPFNEKDLEDMLGLLRHRHIRSIGQAARGGMLYALDRDHAKVTKQDFLDALKEAKREEGST